MVGSSISFLKVTLLLDRLADTPGAALGSSRANLNAEEIGRLLEAFRRHDVRCFFYNGGNGSMGTALDIETEAHATGYELQVIGIPKTVDNDIVETDHTPGYGSAARFWAHATRDMGIGSPRTTIAHSDMRGDGTKCRMGGRRDCIRPALRR